MRILGSTKYCPLTWSGALGGDGSGRICERIDAPYTTSYLYLTVVEKNTPPFSPAGVMKLIPASAGLNGPIRLTDYLLSRTKKKLGRVGGKFEKMPLWEIRTGALAGGWQGAGATLVARTLLPKHLVSS